ncbi:WAT1-related protein At5g40240 isoform X2 [Hevea brasiliensis]|uniref:WAT1-related protein At5g40240 isoform X2 n=1 Tax=Hevea brasiliensis TaxID=3981 RepID=UPI0025E35589|nr:WAT1-related protein At5g40240 isoform X2 [Hevea brasiliensis]
MAVRLCSIGPSLPFIGMVMVILAQVSNLVVCKVAMSRGMNKYVLIVYCNALSSLILLPCSLIFHRSERPSLTFSILFRIFLLALLGMEKLDWRSTSSLAKSLGTIVSIAGAFVVTFYKGPSLLKTSSIALWPLQQLLFSKSIWVVGAFLLAAEAFIISAWYILQTLTVRSFPAVFTIMFYSCLFGTILSAFCCLLEVEDASDWQLRLDVGLVAVLYSAIVATVFQSSLCMWCLWKAGPLFVSMFKPLAIIFAVVLDAIFLGENLGLGSLIGATVIVTGFYAVMWGKAKEEYITDDKELGSSGLSVENVRLLQT